MDTKSTEKVKEEWQSPIYLPVGVKHCLFFEMSFLGFNLVSLISVFVSPPSLPVPLSVVLSLELCHLCLCRTSPPHVLVKQVQWD